MEETKKEFKFSELNAELAKQANALGAIHVIIPRDVFAFDMVDMEGKITYDLSDDRIVNIDDFVIGYIKKPSLMEQIMVRSADKSKQMLETVQILKNLIIKENSHALLYNDVNPDAAKYIISAADTLFSYIINGSVNLAYDLKKNTK